VQNLLSNAYVLLIELTISPILYLFAIFPFEFYIEHFQKLLSLIHSFIPTVSFATSLLFVARSSPPSYTPGENREIKLLPMDARI